MAEIIDGRALADEIKCKISQYVENVLNDKGVFPELAVILVGNNPASMVYVEGKKKASAQVGIKSTSYEIPENTKQEELIELIEKLNKDERVNGILVQLPLPAHIDSSIVLEKISPLKDVDGLTSTNLGMLAKGSPDAIIPCTPLGCMSLIKKVKKDLSGLHAVVIGRSNLVGRPVAELLLRENCTVTVCHSKTPNMTDITKQADILVSATGYAGLVKKDWVKAGAIVIDVGITRADNGKLAGDISFDEVKEVAGYITKVPGGVGPMTITCLLINTLIAACRQNDLSIPKLD